MKKEKETRTFIHWNSSCIVMMENSDNSLLSKTQSLIRVERSLTATIEKVEPWLVSNTLKKSSLTDHMDTRVRPIPRTMEQVHQILAVGRNLASRTSAPAGWNPQAPLVGFSTPNPLPHQLRGGALAALQLDRARKTENDRKRQREQAEVVQQAAKKREQEEAETKPVKQEERAQQKEASSQPVPRPQLRRASSNQPLPPTDTNMRLSSSSEEESSSDEEED